MPGTPDKPVQKSDDRVSLLYARRVEVGEERAMRLDRDAERVLELARLSGRPPYEALSPDEARASFAAAARLLAPEPPPVAEIRDLGAPREDGGRIPLRLYRGIGADPTTPLPALVFFHGGGGVLGGLDSHDDICRRLANAAECAVVAVDYRLAPEHKFPAAVEDCVGATDWLAENAALLGIDRRRLAVGGDSVGGNFAAVVGLGARDGGPALRFQLLLYPALDFAPSGDSHRRLGEGYLLTAATLRWFCRHYLRTPADLADWRASPLKAPSLAGLPPAFVLTAGFDPLADDGIAYARRLRQDRVAVRHRHLPDQIHGFLTMGRVVRAAQAELEAVGAALRAGLAPF